MTVNELIHEWIENEKLGHIKPRTYQMSKPFPKSSDIRMRQ